MSGERHKNEDTTPSQIARLDTHINGMILITYSTLIRELASVQIPCCPVLPLAKLNPQIMAAELEANQSSHGLTSGRKGRVARAKAPLCSVKSPVKGGEAWQVCGMPEVPIQILKDLCKYQLIGSTRSYSPSTPVCKYGM